MSKPDEVFVNTLAVNGFLNGVINLTFTTARWSAALSQNPAEAAQGQMVVVANDYESLFLRMDLNCAREVHEALGRIIDQQTKDATVN